MASERAVVRYRRWYDRLLRLYPRRFRERFAEPMSQTFADLIRERRGTREGVHTFAARAFAETLAQIMRENMTQLMETTNVIRWGRWVLVTAALLAVPALAMALNLGVPDPGSGTDGVNWGPMDFAVAGFLILGSGLLYEYAAARVRGLPVRAATGIAVLAALGLIWVNLAVGMMDVETGNLMYVPVVFVALVGIAVARFEPRHAAVAMFATAAVHAGVAVIALVAGLGPTLPADAFYVAGWIASALLFRRRSLQASTG